MWKLIVHVLESEASFGGGERIAKPEVLVPNIAKGKAAVKKIMKEGVFGESLDNLSYYPPSCIRKIEIVAVEMPKND